MVTKLQRSQDLAQCRINKLTYEQINHKIWKNKGPTELVSLTDVFTDFELVAIPNHPDYRHFPNHFKDWVWSTIDHLFFRKEETSTQRPSSPLAP